MVIPYLVPSLPQKQKDALAFNVKAPIVYTSVAVRNWKAFQKLGVSHIESPTMYHTSVSLTEAASLGELQHPQSSDEPIVLHMVRTPNSPGKARKEQHRLGRYDLLSTSWETFERNIREQLARTLEPGGFDPANDIVAITVNRWPHGYAPEYNPLFKPELPLDEQPQVVGRARFGRITIANSDAGAAAYTDSAIDQAHRAVGELLRG
jgi:spermidine dehydrogenase